MSEKDDFVSFDKALRDLQLRSEELKKLVSEGEIRAFRDGDSMKFRSEDIAALGHKDDGGDELAFADSLEDDTGMVTEQLSAEDTLLAEDDEPETVDRPRRNSPRVAAGRATRATAVAEESVKEPGWVTAFAIVGFLLMVWGFIVMYSIAQESDPAGNMFTSLFAEKK